MKSTSENQDKYVLVPIAMCIHVIQNNLENPFRFYSTLKLLYPYGKLKFKTQEIKVLASTLNVTARTITSYIKKLVELKWIRLNNKTQYYLINSFDRLRIVNNWESRASIEFYLNDTDRTRAFLGAALFGYLHKDFWRKVKRERIVTIKGVTYHTLSPSFNYKNYGAPISVYGVNNFFNISIAKVSRLKTLAYNEGLIEVEKNYVKYGVDKLHALMVKKYHSQRTRNLVYKDGSYYLQQIDLILPLFDLRRRKKLEP